MPGVRVDFSKEETSSDLDRLFPNTGLRGIVEGSTIEALTGCFCL